MKTGYCKQLLNRFINWLMLKYMMVGTSSCALIGCHAAMVMG